jgi:hypothetical protein
MEDKAEKSVMHRGHDFRIRNINSLMQPAEANAQYVVVDVPWVDTSGLGKVMTVAEALARPPDMPLDQASRRALIDQLILSLDQVYVHMAMKRARHAVDPVGALVRLRHQAHEYPAFEFHLRIMRIFKSLRDQHTAYVPPKPYSDMIAFLPFLLGTCHVGNRAVLGASTSALLDENENDPNAPDVIVTNLLRGFSHPHFRPGAQILSWNGTPVDIVVRDVGRSEQAANPGAEYALGSRLMTVRWLGGSLPPAESVINVGYRSPDDIPDTCRPREIRFAWNVIEHQGDRAASLQAMWDMTSYYASATLPTSSRDSRAMIERNARQNLFPRRDEIQKPPKGIRRDAITVANDPRNCFVASKLTVDIDGQPMCFGLLRIVHFEWWDKDFRDTFVEILAMMPPNGLAIDIRSNPGGEVRCAESILQTLTDRRIEPLPFQFLANDVVQDLIEPTRTRPKADVAAWKEGLAAAVDSASMFSGFAPMTPPSLLNDIGRKYQGPVILLINAVTYSSGDIFAASFQDHEIGPVLGVDSATGGGGANVWARGTFIAHNGPDARFASQPGWGEMHMAVRRCTRLGKCWGMPIEEAGVTPDLLHETTRSDLLQQDADLLLRVARELRSLNP